ncbi:hypothetical protein GGS26DRAFT_599175 [Hypomontagnella submonticulosa]|nr:hypothetical protein GGS26DRAFT_599175 [Hypomontagnella submonticulosa]
MSSMMSLLLSLTRLYSSQAFSTILYSLLCGFLCFVAYVASVRPRLVFEWLVVVAIFMILATDVSFLTNAPLWPVSIWLFVQIYLTTHTSYGSYLIWAASVVLVTVNHGWAVLYWTVPLIASFYVAKHYLSKIRVEKPDGTPSWSYAFSELKKAIDEELANEKFITAARHAATESDTTVVPPGPVVAYPLPCIPTSTDAPTPEPVEEFDDWHPWGYQSMPVHPSTIAPPVVAPTVIQPPVYQVPVYQPPVYQPPPLPPTSLARWVIYDPLPLCQQSVVIATEPEPVYEENVVIATEPYGEDEEMIDAGDIPVHYPGELVVYQEGETESDLSDRTDRLAQLDITDPFDLPVMPAISEDLSELPDAESDPSDEEFSELDLSDMPDVPAQPDASGPEFSDLDLPEKPDVPVLPDLPKIDFSNVDFSAVDALPNPYSQESPMHDVKEVSQPEPTGMPAPEPVSQPSPNPFRPIAQPRRRLNRPASSAVTTVVGTSSTTPAPKPASQSSASPVYCPPQALNKPAATLAPVVPTIASLTKSVSTPTTTPAFKPTAAAQPVQQPAPQQPAFTFNFVPATPMTVPSNNMFGFQGDSARPGPSNGIANPVQRRRPGQPPTRRPTTTRTYQPRVTASAAAANAAAAAAKASTNKDDESDESDEDDEEMDPFEELVISILEGGEIDEEKARIQAAKIQSN